MIKEAIETKDTKKLIEIIDELVHKKRLNHFQVYEVLKGECSQLTMREFSIMMEKIA